MYVVTYLCIYVGLYVYVCMYVEKKVHLWDAILFLASSS
jgi:hypothetical protein